MYILIAVNTLCPEKKHLFSNISLSRNMAADVKLTSGDICQEFQYLSLALDESTDVKVKAQLAIFV